ncbi:MAG: c-type cytochrome biogenesis protein CcmI [Shewanella sp.]|nr:c-type cytochrome biogenesis protein CcmI [Shewanella sp.]MCF1432043.1 c-type cytochrome biogenesis protein CcmI [Shewanella sp.]MCF1458990.1 c-type cytochrome biogenesis protein CcmI [Shewanella sp.]
MTTFWIFIALVLLVSLLLIWLPHFRQQKLIRAEEAGVRNNTNVELFNERLAALEKELKEQLLDQQEFDALKKELEVSLLQDMKQGTDESLSQQAKPKGILWPAVMSVAMIAITGYSYMQLGAYNELPFLENPQASNPHAGMTQEQMISQQIEMMEAQVKSQPDNSQLWFNLGHAYTSANRYDEAIAAFDKVMELVGEHAELLGPKATAMYYKNNQTMTPAIQAIVDQSLSKDPKDPSTLLLVGMDAFYAADYNKAINAWETLLTNDRQDIDRASVNNAIQTARMRMAAESGEMPNDANHAGVAAEQKTVTVEISIAPELQNKVASTDMLFVFARNTEGEKVPLAATKISAKTLPAKVVLDNSTSMGGSLKLSDAKNVEIIAILSKHGSVRPKAGDMKGELASVPVGDTTALVVDTLVQ